MTRLFGFVVAVLWAGAACAQEPLNLWPDLAPSRLPTVYVVDDTGKETEGKLLRFNPDSIVIVVDNMERRFEAARVLRIQRRGDSLRNGAVIGAIVGVPMGLLSAGLSDCIGSETSASDGCPGSRVALVAASAGIYAAMGAGIDALIHGRTTLYIATTRSASARPLLTARALPAGASVDIRISW
jgi:hypothetical protein